MDNTESYSNDLTVRLNNYFINNTDQKREESWSPDNDMLVKKTFRNTLYVYHKMYGIMFITSQGNNIITSDNLLSGDNYEKITDSFLSRKENDCMWLDMGSYNFTSGRHTVLPYCKKIVNINTGDSIGYMAVMIDEDTFSGVFSNINDGAGSAQYFFCDRNGIVVSSEDKSAVLKPVADSTIRKWVVDNKNGHIITSVKGKRTLITKTTFSPMGWRLICEAPMESVTAESRRISLTVILLGFLFLIVSALFSDVISLSITKPLYRLIRDVQNLNLENLDAVTKVEQGGDVGLLAKSFNLMKSRIVELLDNNRRHEEKQRKYELNLLQAQIKPHFLYNTLQLIYAMIEMGEEDKARKAVKSLADFYRTALNNGNEIITMGKELSNTEDYLSIQKIRYSDSFEYSLECDAGLKKYKIPKLTLQPIVENAVSHGLAGREANGVIRIIVKKYGDKIDVEVNDNGAGMSQEKISEIINGDCASRSGSFGLKNIDERIKLYYGYSYGLRISSREGKGTSVDIYIPAIENWNDENS
ncbi:sensor histidine kinase [Caproicibacter fermentans]|nr:sensor histidine kinase [Caproicibacter fermentans]